MEKQWRRYVVFISSTFKDMDPERDIIKLHVIPALNRHYRDRMIEIQPIDLRLGIDTSGMTEQESENKILDVCMSCINNARPFFIGLLGDRYGWVPSGERWQDFIRKQTPEARKLFENSLGSSVTELEIIYGAIGGNGEWLNHSLFFVRDETSYKNLPPAMLATYRDASDLSQPAERRQENIRRQTELKRKIRQAVADRKHEMYAEYHLSWNLQKQRFDHLDAFAALVFDRLAVQIDQELSAADPMDDTWLGQERVNIAAHTGRNIEQKLSRHYTQIADSARHILFTGTVGCGKSILLSQLFNAAQHDSQRIALYAAVASSPHTLTMRQILIMWIFELSEVLEQSAPDDQTLLSERSTSLPTLYEFFYEQVRQAADRGLEVTLFLDGVERFARFSPADIYLPWLNEQVKFRGCIDEEHLDNVMQHNSRLRIVRMGTLAEEELPRFIAQYEEEYQFVLPQTIRDELPGTAPTPLFLRTVFMLLSNLSTKDFQQIRTRNGQPVDAINRYLYGLFRAIPRDAEALLPHLLRNLIGHLRIGKIFYTIFEYIALAPTGLRESDLERLVGKDWNTLDFHALTNLLTDFLFENRSLHSWQIDGAQFGQTLMTPNRKRMLYDRIATSLARLDDGDSEKERMLAYYILKAERADLASEWLCPEELCFDVSKPMRRRYALPVSYLISDPDFFGHVTRMAGTMSPETRVSFVASLLLSGCQEYLYTRPQIAITFAALLPEKIDLQILPLPRTFEVASICKEIVLISKYLSHASTQMVLHYAQRAADAFRYCYQQNTAYHDSRNLLVAMLTELLPLYAESGDFEAMERAYAETQAIFDT